VRSWRRTCTSRVLTVGVVVKDGPELRHERLVVLHVRSRALATRHDPPSSPSRGQVGHVGDANSGELDCHMPEGRVAGGESAGRGGEDGRAVTTMMHTRNFP